MESPISVGMNTSVSRNTFSPISATPRAFELLSSHYYDAQRIILNEALQILNKGAGGMWVTGAELKVTLANWKAADGGPAVVIYVIEDLVTLRELTPSSVIPIDIT